MLEDRFGLPLSTESEDAAAAYVAGLDLLLSANLGGGEELANAIALDPDFALAHAAVARLWQMAAQPERASEAMARAETLAAGTSKREQAHIEITALVISGQGKDAFTNLTTHLETFPRDALPLSYTLGVYGLLGFSGRTDHHEAQRNLLDQLAPAWGNDWWFKTYQGWAHIEAGNPAGGLEMLETARAGNRRNGHLAHALSHGYYELGEIAEGDAFLTDWLPDYGTQSPLYNHLSWHHALLKLAAGDIEVAEALYDTRIRPGAATAIPIFRLVDFASFQWRRKVLGHALDTADLQENAAYTRENFPKPGLGFVNIHIALVLAAAGEGAALEDHLAAVREMVTAGQQPPGQVVVDICTGLAAYADEDWEIAANRLAKAQNKMTRIGGSHAQRDLLTDTLISALLKLGRREEAELEMKHRIETRAPQFGVDWFEELAGE